MRTYVIESQSVFLPYLTRVLERAGCEIVATNRVVDSVDIAEKAPVAVVVDVDYFAQGGPTLLCHVRSAHETAKIIVLSEIEDALFRATCIFAGASLVCSKGDGEEKLVRKIRGAFESRELEKRLKPQPRNPKSNLEMPTCG